MPRNPRTEVQKEAARAYGVAYRLAHPGKAAVDSAAWRIAHPEKVREANQKALARYKRWLAVEKAEPCVDCGIVYPPYVMDFTSRSYARPEII
jgi:hypothetical protein